MKVGKKKPFTLANFDDFFELLPTQGDSQKLTVQRKDIDAKNYDLKAVNPTAKATGRSAAPKQLLDLIESEEPRSGQGAGAPGRAIGDGRGHCKIRRRQTSGIAQAPSLPVERPALVQLQSGDRTDHPNPGKPCRLPP